MGENSFSQVYLAESSAVVDHCYQVKVPKIALWPFLTSYKLTHQVKATVSYSLFTRGYQSRYPCVLIWKTFILDAFHTATEEEICISS